jgi:sigma-B regulation protein RsbU (phosphoserine phosphatase)
VDRNGSIDEMRTPSTALGMDRNAKFTELAVRCEPGDVFLLYTDGLVETASESGEQFGAGRLKEVLTRSRDLAPGQLCESLTTGADAFRGRTSVVDDVTVVALKVG